MEPLANNLQLDTKFSRRSKNTITINRPEEPSLEHEYKMTPNRPEKTKKLIAKFEAPRKDKQIMESEIIKHESFNEDESEEAVPDAKIPTINKTSRLSGFDSFDRKQEENVLSLFNKYSLNK